MLETEDNWLFPSRETSRELARDLDSLLSPGSAGFGENPYMAAVSETRFDDSQSTAPGSNFVTEMTTEMFFVRSSNPVDALNNCSSSHRHQQLQKTTAAPITIEEKACREKKKSKKRSDGDDEDDGDFVLEMNDSPASNDSSVSTEKQHSIDPSRKRNKTEGKHQQRVQSACDQCRGRKQRCNGLTPCDRCLKLGVTCSTSERKRPGRKSSNPAKRAEAASAVAEKKPVQITTSTVTTIANPQLAISAAQEWGMSCSSLRGYFLGLYHEFLDPMYEIKTHLRQYQDPSVEAANAAVDAQVNSAVAMAARASGYRALADMAISRAQDLSRNFYDDPSEESYTAFFLMATYYSGQDRNKAIFCARQAKNLINFSQKSAPTLIQEIAKFSIHHELMEVTYLTLQEDSRTKSIFPIVLPVLLRCIRAIGNPARLFLHYLKQFNPPGFIPAFGEELPFSRNLTERQYEKLSSEFRSTVLELTRGEAPNAVFRLVNSLHSVFQSILALRAGKTAICIDQLQTAIALFSISTEFIPGKILSLLFALCEVCIELDRKDLLLQVSGLFKRLGTVYDLAETVQIALSLLVNSESSLRARFLELEPTLAAIEDEMQEFSYYRSDFFDELA